MNNVVWADPRTGNLAWEFAGVLCTLGYNREVQLLSPSEVIGFWMWRYGGWSELSLEAAEGMGIVANAKLSSCACSTLAYVTEHDATRACAWLNTLAACNELRLETEVYACGETWHCRAKPWDGDLEVTVDGLRITWKRVKCVESEDPICALSVDAQRWEQHHRGSGLWSTPSRPRQLDFSCAAFICWKMTGVR